MTDDDPTAPLPAGCRLTAEPPTAPEYVHLRRTAGLSPRTPEQAAGALENSWAWTTIRTADGALAAMGRTLGDGTWYFHLADIATDPAHQRRGLGRAVMEDLIARIERAAPPHPYITLLADPPGQRLYRSLGFVDSAPSLGMRLPR
ncbi:GNAT family N-acetyltransferase [Brachybacterium saurashtrense]|uniref:GNAT family N-acetyltransferase n=1 Tax=Brachybacterium saurashtrense TaxID=556288 RepID=A0A345YNF8_9MICO|nr:GNAT family N-acetyltransferase [Brachybacterium saurashtrense]AXK45460.1 GNAT family N-acetyltransferase [Brachybacterium saurashtrense]RRR21167.1 GNAT family N-acetyltransferase [Brachybacterium saurashtrense]